MTDLVVRVADKNMEFSIRGILSRSQSLGIKMATSNTYVHPERDPGCFLKAHEFLRAFQDSHSHGLVVFDRKGCGRDAQTRQNLETQVERQLSGSGWGHRAACVVVDPELENWVWSDSPHFDTLLGWQGRTPALRQWLREKGVWPTEAPKPARPKEAVEQALRIARKPRSSSLYLQLAESVGLDRCSDSAFLKLRDTLANWFPRQRSFPSP
jgi:hypothetical protein